MTAPVRQTAGGAKVRALPAQLATHAESPIYLGNLLAVVGHDRRPDLLAAALLITGYILVGIQLEEHNIVPQFGERVSPLPPARGHVRLRFRAASSPDLKDADV